MSLIGQRMSEVVNHPSDYKTYIRSLICQNVRLLVDVVIYAVLVLVLDIGCFISQLVAELIYLSHFNYLHSQGYFFKIKILLLYSLALVDLFKICNSCGAIHSIRHLRNASRIQASGYPLLLSHNKRITYHVMMMIVSAISGVVYMLIGSCVLQVDNNTNFCQSLRTTWAIIILCGLLMSCVTCYCSGIIYIFVQDYHRNRPLSNEEIAEHRQTELKKQYYMNDACDGEDSDDESLVVHGIDDGDENIIWAHKYKEPIVDTDAYYDD